MDNLTYFKAKSLNEAFDVLDEAGGKKIILAGGTDIMVEMNRTPGVPGTTIVYIGDIAGLKEIKETDEEIRIGALVTASQIEASDIIHKYATTLHQAAAETAGPMVRNRATIGGNIGTASPAGDMISALNALNADVVIASKSGTEKKKIGELITGVKKTSLKPGQIITEIIIPKKSGIFGSAFLKQGKRKAMAISIANTACALSLSADGRTIADISLVIGSAATTTVHAIEVEKALKGHKVDEAAIKEKAKLVVSSINPITDQRTTKWYRVEVIPVMLARTIMEAISQANSEEVAI